MNEADPSGKLLLYPGEIFDTIAGFPTIYHYRPASDTDARKPLIVCVTGGLHLARVFYGGHTGSKPSDFLTYWLKSIGFGVLSLSYPLESTPQIMPPTAAEFRVHDWGRQAAMTAKKVMEESNLTTRSVVLISWSMGGRMVARFNTSAKELNLEVQQYISFAATPGFSSIRPISKEMYCSPTGYLHAEAYVDMFYQQLKEMESLNGGREIIPKDHYLREYFGGMPIRLAGLRLKHNGQGAFIRDELTHEEDTAVLDAASFPLVTALYPTSILDASHALTDRASWGFLLANTLQSMIGNKGLVNLKGTPKWNQLLELVHSAPSRLFMPVPGNHFFFVGEKSAKEIAESVAQLVDTAVEFRKELGELIA